MPFEALLCPVHILQLIPITACTVELFRVVGCKFMTAFMQQWPPGFNPKTILAVIIYAHLQNCVIGNLCHKGFLMNINIKINHRFINQI